jgi:hypothetical protein
MLMDGRSGADAADDGRGVTFANPDAVFAAMAHDAGQPLEVLLKGLFVEVQQKLVAGGVIALADLIDHLLLVHG